MATIDIASSITRHRNDKEGVARNGGRSGGRWGRGNRIIEGPASSRGCLPKDVAHAAHRMDQPRLTVGFGLAPQVAHVYLQRIARGGEVEPPDLLEDAAAREHPARIGDRKSTRLNSSHVE